jgi:FkbM family methyltransferase
MIKTKLYNFFRLFLRNERIERIIINKIIKNNNSIFRKFAPNYYQYKKGTYRTFKRNGIIMNVDISDFIGHSVYFGFEDFSQKDLFNLANQNDVILDIGGNIGYTALRFAIKLKNGRGVIYSFEPDSFNFSQLQKNKNLNPYLPLMIFNFGLGNSNEKLKLHVNTLNNLGGNRINEDATENFEIVEIKRVDDFIVENQIHKVDLIKIDVEGFELNVLLGCKNVIEKYRPKLFIEIDDNNLRLQNKSAKELILFLEKYYDNIFDAVTNEKVSSRDNFSNCHFDVIAEIS